MRPFYLRLILLGVALAVIVLIMNIAYFFTGQTNKLGIDDMTPDANQNVRIGDIRACMNRSRAVYRYDMETALYLLPSKDDMCAMPIEDLELLYQLYLSTIQTVCTRPLRLGNRNDGGWDLCVEKRFMTPGKCRVYSFGINDDFSFDDDVAKQFRCEVHSFDPSMEQASYQRSTSPYVYFHAIGISSQSRTVIGNKQWRILNLKDTQSELGHTSIPDVIKMDIEYWEWDVLPDVLSHPQLAKQLVVEYHLWGPDYVTHKHLWIHRLWTLKDIYDAGYRTFWINRNYPCTFMSPVTSAYMYACHEVSYVKVADDVRQQNRV